jgi:hypothetical protein
MRQTGALIKNYHNLTNYDENIFELNIVLIKYIYAPTWGK